VGRDQALSAPPQGAAISKSPSFPQRPQAATCSSSLALNASNFSRKGFIQSVVKPGLALLFIFAGAFAAGAASDPAELYLSNFSPLRGDKTIASNDTLLRLELDLDGDGQYEVLLSMARDVDGDKGNVWSVYANTTSGYTTAGKITFNPKSFYLGPIDDLGDYGLVTFKSSVGSEGMLAAYLFNGATVREIEIATITRDPETGQLRGQALIDKYMKQAADGAEAVTSTDAATLARKLGMKVDPKGNPPAQPNPYSTSSASDSSSSAGPDQSSPPTSGAESSWSIRWTLLVVILVLAAAGTAFWIKRR
jgi:hypothetical protein